MCPDPYPDPTACGGMGSQRLPTRSRSDSHFSHRRQSPSSHHRSPRPILTDGTGSRPAGSRTPHAPVRIRPLGADLALASFALPGSTPQSAPGSALGSPSPRPRIPSLRIPSLRIPSLPSDSWCGAAVSAYAYERRQRRLVTNSGAFRPLPVLAPTPSFSPPFLPRPPILLPLPNALPSPALHTLLSPSPTQTHGVFSS